MSGEGYGVGPKFYASIYHEKGVWFSDIIEFQGFRDIKKSPRYSGTNFEDRDWETVCIKVGHPLNHVNEVSVRFADDPVLELGLKGVFHELCQTRTPILFIAEIYWQGEIVSSEMGEQFPGCKGQFTMQPGDLYCAGEFKVRFR